MKTHYPFGVGWCIEFGKETVMSDQEMSAEKMLASYKDATATMEKLEKALEVLKGQRSNLVKGLYDLSGKGPYTVEGRECNIVVKGDTYYFLPVKTAGSGGGPRKAAPSAETLARLAEAVRAKGGPVPVSVIARDLGEEVGPKFSELVKAALEQGLITKTGERAATRYSVPA